MLAALKNVPWSLEVHFSFARKVLRVSHKKNKTKQNWEPNQIMKELFFDDVNMTFKISHKSLKLVFLCWVSTIRSLPREELRNCGGLTPLFQFVFLFQYRKIH